MSFATISFAPVSISTAPAVENSVSPNESLDSSLDAFLEDEINKAFNLALAEEEDDTTTLQTIDETDLLLQDGLNDAEFLNLDFDALLEESSESSDSATNSLLGEQPLNFSFDSLSSLNSPPLILPLFDFEAEMAKLEAKTSAEQSANVVSYLEHPSVVMSQSKSPQTPQKAFFGKLVFSKKQNVSKKSPIKGFKLSTFPNIRPFSPKKPKQKRAKPQFTSKYYHRADKYWSTILANNTYQNVLQKAAKQLQRLNLSEIPADKFKRKTVAALLPNYVEVDAFQNFQGVDGWHYKKNASRDASMLSLRWCGQKQNFYQSFVYRHRLAENGKEIEKQFLCPYCPFSKDMVFDNIFYTASTAAYQHHVCKDHGVYTTGYEMPLPVIGMINEEPVAYCTECEHTHKIVLDTEKNDLQNCLIAHFRHCFESHNLKRQCRSNDTKYKDELNQRVGRDGYLYEDPEAILSSLL